MREKMWMTLSLLAADPPTINFEMAGGSNVVIREGESLELCVVLQASRIPFEFLFPVLISRSVEIVTSKYFIMQ